MLPAAPRVTLSSFRSRGASCLPLRSGSLRQRERGEARALSYALGRDGCSVSHARGPSRSVIILPAQKWMRGRANSTGQNG